MNHIDYEDYTNEINQLFDAAATTARDYAHNTYWGAYQARYTGNTTQGPKVKSSIKELDKDLKQWQKDFQELFKETEKLIEFDLKELKCECGGEAANTTHSNWCPIVTEK